MNNDFIKHYIMSYFNVEPMFISSVARFYYFGELQTVWKVPNPPDESKEWAAMDRFGVQYGYSLPDILAGIFLETDKRMKG